MAKMTPVSNKKNTPPSTSGFPKSVQNKRTNNKAVVPTAKKGGSMGKKGC